jgi:hypothetical protein
MSKKSYKKNSYRKKHAKTQKGGKRGRGYKRTRTHKRGKRFHRGGAGDFGDDVIEPGSTIEPTLLPETNIPTLDNDMLPIYIKKFSNKKKMPNALQFDYKRTDGRHMLGVGGTEQGLFDVVLFKRGDQTNTICLLRHSKSAPTKYDKQLDILIEPFKQNSDLSQPFTGIQGLNIHDNRADGTYTLPATNKNKESFNAINQAINN